MLEILVTYVTLAAGVKPGPGKLGRPALSAVA